MLNSSYKSKLQVKHEFHLKRAQDGMEIWMRNQTTRSEIAFAGLTCICGVETRLQTHASSLCHHFAFYYAPLYQSAHISVSTLPHTYYSNQSRRDVLIFLKHNTQQHAWSSNTNTLNTIFVRKILIHPFPLFYICSKTTFRGMVLFACYKLNEYFLHCVFLYLHVSSNQW